MIDRRQQNSLDNFLPKKGEPFCCPFFCKKTILVAHIFASNSRAKKGGYKDPIFIAPTATGCKNPGKGTGTFTCTFFVRLADGGGSHMHYDSVAPSSAGRNQLLRMHFAVDFLLTLPFPDTINSL